MSYPVASVTSRQAALWLKQNQHAVDSQTLELSCMG